MGFKLSLFDQITLIILGVTLLTAISFARRKLDRNWPFLYFLLILVYWKIFEGALNTAWVGIGIAAGILLRFRFPGERIHRILWWLELAVLSYIAVRCVDLLLGGELLHVFGGG